MNFILIEEKSDFRCSGTFSSIDEAKVFLADYCRSTDYEPLICIVDINLGDKADDEDGLSLIRFIKENTQGLAVSVIPCSKELELWNRLLRQVRLPMFLKMQI